MVGAEGPRRRERQDQDEWPRLMGLVRGGGVNKSLPQGEEPRGRGYKDVSKCHVGAASFQG